MAKNTTIQDLMARLALKEEKIASITNSYTTPMAGFEWNGRTFNLHVLSVEQLEILYCQVYNTLETAKSLDWKLRQNGYFLQDWANDILNKIRYINVAEERKEIETLRKRILALRTQEEKRQDELTEIMAILS